MQTNNNTRKSLFFSEPLQSSANTSLEDRFREHKSKSNQVGLHGQRQTLASSFVKQKSTQTYPEMARRSQLHRATLPPRQDDYVWNPSDNIDTKLNPLPPPRSLSRTDSFPKTFHLPFTSNNGQDVPYMGTKKVANPSVQLRQQIPTITGGSAEKRSSRTDSSPITPGNTFKSNYNFLMPSDPYNSDSVIFTKAANKEKVATGPEINDNFYNMDHKYRGRAVIFSHTNFSDGLDSREGSEKDVKNLLEHLPRLGFSNMDITVRRDLSFSDTASELIKLSHMDYSDYDCLMLFVLTHGDKNDKIYASDTEYGVEKLWKNFLGDRCPSLIGKPKIFFVVACRGSNADAGVKVIPRRKLSTTATDAGEHGFKQTRYTIPVYADILVVFSTTPGFYSYREDLRGTWYIEAFCNELKLLKPSEEIDFIDFLTKVNLRLSTSYTTYNPDNMLSDNKKQCSSFYSTLLRKITIKMA